jgi:hypothetical protein
LDWRSCPDQHCGRLEVAPEVRNDGDERDGQPDQDVEPDEARASEADPFMRLQKMDSEWEFWAAQLIG